MRSTDYLPVKKIDLGVRDNQHAVILKIKPVDHTPCRSKKVEDKQFLNIVRAVSDHYVICVDKLLSPERHQARTSRGRQIAMYLCHTLLAHSYSRIGEYFRRDRTTVAHACARVEDLRDGTAFEAELSSLEVKLQKDGVV